MKIKGDYPEGAPIQLSVWLLLSRAAMKNLKLLLIALLNFSNLLEAQVVLPPLFKTTYTFEMRGEDPNESPKSLIELLSFGEQKPALLSIDGGKRVFLMNSPRVDRCGFLHFDGNSVSLEQTKRKGGAEIRFYEQSIKIDISCYPIPFPRCGTFRSTESTLSGEYLMEQLQLLKAQCQAQLIQGEQILESYEIYLP